jgi:hypothetical protein
MGIVYRFGLDKTVFERLTILLIISQNQKIYIFRLTCAGLSDSYLMRLQDYRVYPVSIKFFEKRIFQLQVPGHFALGYFKRERG